MQLLVKIGNNKVTIKRWFCIKINTFVMSIYNKFRDCSGVAERTKIIQEENKRNSTKVKNIEKNLPILKTEIDKIRDRNNYLEGRVASMFNELKAINIHANNGECREIMSLLKKYDFNQKMEK